MVHFKQLRTLVHEICFGIDVQFRLEREAVSKYIYMHILMCVYIYTLAEHMYKQGYMYIYICIYNIISYRIVIQYFILYQIILPCIAYCHISLCHIALYSPKQFTVGVLHFSKEQMAMSRNSSVLVSNQNLLLSPFLVVVPRVPGHRQSLTPMIISSSPCL